MHAISAVLNFVVKPHYFQQGEAFIAWSQLKKMLWSIFSLGIEVVHASCFDPWQRAALLGAVEGKGTPVLPRGIPADAGQAIQHDFGPLPDTDTG